MKLTNRSEYGLLALIYLGRKGHDQLIHGQEISNAQAIPKRFMQQILYSLKQAKLIKSEKGKAGGYALARKPEDVTLAEIIRLFEGPLAPSRSVSKYYYESTPIEREKKMLILLKELRTIVSDKLEKTTLADML